jgi:hypothetical protein
MVEDIELDLRTYESLIECVVGYMYDVDVDVISILMGVAEWIILLLAVYV